MFDKIVPVADNVLVKKIVPDEKSESGLYMPPNSETDSKINHGDVIAVGPGKYSLDGTLIHMKIKVGQKVCFPKYGGVELDSEYVMLREDNILGVMDIQA